MAATRGKTKRRAAARKVGKSRPKVKRKPARKPVGKARKRVARAAKPAAKVPRGPAGKAAGGAERSAGPIAVTVFTLERVQVAPLRYEAAAALGRLETVQLFAGTSEEGARVETLVFSPSGSGVQSSGEYVHRGEWNGSQLLTARGHLLDVDGLCFCRDCETAGGYTVDDDE